MSRTIEQRMSDVVCEELSAFATWCEKEWSLTKEMAKNDPELRAVSDDYIKGYNAALEALPLALECYRDE